MLISDEVILRRLRIFKCKSYYNLHRISPLVFETLYCIFSSSYGIFIRQCLEVIEKLTLFGRILILINVNCLDETLMTDVFLSFMLVALCAPSL